MLQTLLVLLPNEALVVAFVIAGLLLMIGFRKSAATIIGMVLLFAIARPFIDFFLARLPDWSILLLLVIGGVVLFSSIMGRGVRDRLMAKLLMKVMELPFIYLGWILRGFKMR